VTLVAPAVGTAYGLAAAASPPLIGELLMRAVDGLLGVPRLPLYLVLLTLAGPSFWTVVLVMALFEWTTAARLAYTGTLGELAEPRIEAARALGAGPARVLGRHVLPHVLAPLVVTATAGFRTRIVAEASLSYLGFGIAPPVPSWGNMLAAAQSQLWERPSLAVYPGLAILLVTIGANLLGDALRDALDPRTR
jgi:peptide/nickel transport system permease protein